MATLESELLPATKDDLSNHKRQYKITFNKPVETIGITRHKTKIISTSTQIARDNFIPNSDIIEINSITISDDTPNITQLITDCKNNPKSFIILQCNNEMVVKGFHFQLKLKFIVNNFTKIPMEQLTKIRLEQVLSETFYSKNVVIYDIFWSQHCTGIIIVGFIFDPIQACQYLMQCIKFDLDFYKKLRKDITNIFQRRLVNKTLDRECTDLDANFEWNISQINAFTASFDVENGGIGSNISVLQKIWATHEANIFNKKINIKNNKAVLRELVKISMGCYVAWQFRNESFDSGRNVNTYHFQHELWVELITNWMYKKYFAIISEKGALKYEDFEQNYFIYLKQFCDKINTNSEIDNINFVVAGYLKQTNNIIPTHIVELIEEYVCDVSIHISLQNYKFDQRYKKIDVGLPNYSLSNYIHILTTKAIGKTDQWQWVAFLTSPKTRDKFMKVVESKNKSKISIKNFAVVIASGMCLDGRKKIPHQALQQLNQKFFLKFVTT